MTIFLHTTTDLQVHSNVWKIGKLSLSNPGDLDVVAIDMRAQRIWVIECKDLASAPTPFGGACDLKELFGEEGGKSHTQKFKRRLTWLQHHREAFLQHLALDTNLNWKLRSLVVLSQELLAPHLQPSSEVPIITYQQLTDNCLRTDLLLDHVADTEKGNS